MSCRLLKLVLLKIMKWSPERFWKVDSQELCAQMLLLAGRLLAESPGSASDKVLTIDIHLKLLLSHFICTSFISLFSFVIIKPRL